MIPVPQLAAELAIGLGAALFGASALVLIRVYIRRDDDRPAPRPPSIGKVVINMAIGAVVALIGLASLLRLE
ncbi:MAG: hypothetical protein ABR518_06975 [Actinomycetota bacterium]